MEVFPATYMICQKKLIYVFFYFIFKAHPTSVIISLLSPTSHVVPSLWVTKLFSIQWNWMLCQAPKKHKFVITVIQLA